MEGRSEVGRAPALDDAAADAATIDTAHQDHATLVDATDWPAERWDRLAVGRPAGHAFQSHAGGELKRPLGWTPQRFVVELRGQPVAAVSFQERNLAPRLPGPLGKRTYLYVPRRPILLEDSAAAARPARPPRPAPLVPLLADEAEQPRLVRKSTANLINRARREGAAAERIDLANAQPADQDRALGEMHDLLVATARREGIVLRGRAYQPAPRRGA